MLEAEEMTELEAARVAVTITVLVLVLVLTLGEDATLATAVAGELTDDLVEEVAAGADEEETGAAETKEEEEDTREETGAAEETAEAWALDCELAGFEIAEETTSDTT